MVLQTRAMPEWHTAENIANILTTAAEEWGVTGKVLACVHDNANNITLAYTSYLE